jgi:hypothetical protein
MHRDLPFFGKSRKSQTNKERQRAVVDKNEKAMGEVSSSIAKIRGILIRNPSIESEFGTNKKARLLKETRPLLQMRKERIDTITGLRPGYCIDCLSLL